MMLTGTLVNAAGILLGGGAGLLVRRLMRRGVPERFSDIVMKGIGLCTIYIAATGLLDGSKSLVTILSVVIGAVLGEWLDLDGKIRALSEKLEKKFSRQGDSSFAQGFMAATLLFCVGTMAIKGSLDGGLRGDHATLYAKSVMDTISACIFSSTLGFGVLFSVVPVVLYQGAITLLAAVAGPYLGDAVIAEMNTVGSLLLLGLSLDLLGIAHLKLMNYIPAMFLPILLCLFL